MLKPGRWQHRNNNDLQLEILRVLHRAPAYTLVRALYYRANFGCGELLLDPHPDTLVITNEQYSNWRFVTVI